MLCWSITLPCYIRFLYVLYYYHYCDIESSDSSYILWLVFYSAASSCTYPWPRRCQTSNYTYWRFWFILLWGIVRPILLDMLLFCHVISPLAFSTASFCTWSFVMYTYTWSQRRSFSTFLILLFRQVPPGDYRISPVTTVAENAAGLMFTPAHMDVTVTKPILDAIFTQVFVLNMTFEWMSMLISCYGLSFPVALTELG